MTMATKHKLIGSLAILLLLLLPIGVARSQRVKTSNSDANAIRVLDEWMAAWNARDQQRLATTCNFPHVRIAAGKVTVWQTPSEFEKGHLNSVPLEPNWDHSGWGRRKVIQSSDDKVHVALSFTRYDVKGNKIATYEALYIVTNQNGHWGVQARSSFAP
jgi:hypothetical protein